MQTFLPCPDFKESAHCLDNKRLGKQRVEVLQILKALHIPNYGWKNHPAVKMWKGYELSLAQYGMVICMEWRFSRGYEDSCFFKIWSLQWKFPAPPGLVVTPHWFGNEDFHNSHKAALLAKDPKWYGQFGWDVEPRIEYVWPV